MTKRNIFIFYILFLGVLLSCRGQNERCLEQYKSIPLNIVSKQMECNKLFYDKVVQFRSVENHDSSAVRIIALMFHDKTCAIDILPCEYQKVNKIDNYGDFSFEGNGYAMSYVEQMAMLYNVVQICKDKYKIKGFVHLRSYLSCMGDLCVELSEKYDNLKNANVDMDKYEIMNLVMQNSNFVSDIKSIFEKEDIIYEMYPAFLFPQKFPYELFALHNKLLTKHNTDSVYSGLCVEYVLHEK